MDKTSSNTIHKKYPLPILMLIAILALFALSGCNNAVYYDEYTKAIVKLPNGEIVEGVLDDYMLDSNDSILVTINGIHYYTHRNNVVLYD